MRKYVSAGENCLCHRGVRLPVGKGHDLAEKLTTAEVLPDRQGSLVHRRECQGMSIRKQTVVDWDDGRLCVLRPALLIRF
ncbi:hypothetical protein VEE23_48460 (plasmid) [Escherichia coli]|nr:hypothetical protein VEE23_48460 [Escherichia coli]